MYFLYLAPSLLGPKVLLPVSGSSQEPEFLKNQFSLS